MECNVLNIKAARKQVWLYFSSQNYAACHTPAGTTGNLLNTQKGPYLNQTTQKILAKFSYYETKISNPKKSFQHPHHSNSGVPAPFPSTGALCRTNRNVEAALVEMSVVGGQRYREWQRFFTPPSLSRVVQSWVKITQD